MKEGRSGFLVGFNDGEWGGSLQWCPKDGSTTREVLDDKIVDILASGDRFVVFAGLAHQGLNRGRVIELVEDDSGVRPARMTELGGAPSAAVTEPSGAFLIVTTHGLARLTRDFHVHRILDTDWWFDPVSIVLYRANTAYVGLSGIVVEIKLDTEPPTETWLFPI